MKTRKCAEQIATFSTCPIPKVKNWGVTEKQGRIKNVGKAGKQVHTTLVLLSLL